MEILWEQEGFQFGFKRWPGWAVSKVLWEWIPKVGSKAREGVKAMSLAFVLLDFQHAGVRRRAYCTRQSVNMQQLREVSRTRTTYSTETHTSDFILNFLRHSEMESQCSFSRRGVEWWWRGCQENKSCSKVLNFLERLDERIMCTHEETVAAVKPWEDIGSNTSLGWSSVRNLQIELMRLSSK